MSTIGLHQKLKKRLDSWKEKHIKPEGCGFYVRIKESTIGSLFYFEEQYHIQVEVMYIGINGVSTFFYMQHKMPLYTVSEVTYVTFENMIFKELDNVLKNGKLDKVKDGTFNGWNT